MKQAIDELKAIPGVVGACMFGSQAGLLQCNLPGIFKIEKLSEVGKQLSKLLAAGRLSFSDINDLALHYDESVVIAREMRKGLIVFTICDPSFNYNLLTMSLNLLQDELRDQPQNPMSTGTEPAEAATVNAELEPIFNKIKACLAKILGPIAGIIFDEVLHNWALQGTSIERLPTLLDLLKEEIGDPEKIRSFEEHIAPLLQE